MNLDDIKGKAQQVKAPPIGRADRDSGPRSLDDLVARLRAADDRTRGGMRKAVPLYAIATACFLFVFVIGAWLPPKPWSVGRALFSGVLSGIYLLLTMGLFRQLRRLKEIDYAAPTRQFLAAAEQRYLFMRFKEYLASGIGCVLLGVVAGFFLVERMIPRYIDPEHRTLMIVLYAVSYLGLCTAGFVFTYRNWKRDKRALWLETRRMLAELDSDEAAHAQAAAHQKLD